MYGASKNKSMHSATVLSLMNDVLGTRGLNERAIALIAAYSLDYFDRIAVSVIRHTVIDTGGRSLPFLEGSHMELGGGIDAGD